MQSCPEELTSSFFSVISNHKGKQDLCIYKSITSTFDFAKTENLHMIKLRQFGKMFIPYYDKPSMYTENTYKPMRKRWLWIGNSGKKYKWLINTRFFSDWHLINLVRT